MKMTNFDKSNVFVLFMVSHCLTSCVILAGCADSDLDVVLERFSRLEEEALKYGTVSVGAARVTEYDCNDPSRKRLRDALSDMRCKWLKDPKDKPQIYWINYISRSLAFMLGLNKSQSSTDPNDSFTNLANLSGAVETMMRALPPRPSEIELIGFYMAAQKFVESEMEELNLSQSPDPDYRRFVVSLNLTAWVRGEAKAALVYIDLYPYEADSWCYEAAKIVEEYSVKSEAEYKEEWVKTLEDLGGFTPQSIKHLDPPPKEKLDDCVASCHRWLEKHKLRPSIVQVERMGRGEYLILGEGSYSGTEFQMGGVHPSGISGSLKAETARKAGGLMAKVRPLSLAFVAGERRAGWLFMPGKTTKGRMPPTERRLRMVVDIPKDMVKLGIHVHKIFLDADLGILSNQRFAKQMKNLIRTREILNGADQSYEKYTEEPRHYRLIKTRMRNLLHQGWSEETVVDIPAK